VDSDSSELGVPSLGVASLAACALELGGEDGGSAAPEELDCELGGGPGTVTGGGTVEVSVVGLAVDEVAVVSEGSVVGDSVALASPVVSVAFGAAGHAPVVSATVVEESVVGAEVSVASGAAVHPLVVSAVPAEASVVVPEPSVASAAAADALLVSAVLDVSVVPDASVASAALVGASLVSAVLGVAVVPEASVTSAAVAGASLVSAVLELSVVVAEVSDDDD
jgi:hypothetical protein